MKVVQATTYGEVEGGRRVQVVASVLVDEDGNTTLHGPTVILSPEGKVIEVGCYYYGQSVGVWAQFDAEGRCTEISGLMLPMGVTVGLDN